MRDALGSDEDAVTYDNIFPKRTGKVTALVADEMCIRDRQMIAYGSTVDNVVDELVMLGNVASGVGAPLQDIAYLYGCLLYTSWTT